VQHHQHQRASSQSRFLPKSIPPFIIDAASSTHHHQRTQSIGNAQNTGNAYQQQRRKITSGGETEHWFAVFFSHKPNKLFCVVSVKKTQQT
jgi:hypothetical protein